MEVAVAGLEDSHQVPFAAVPKDRCRHSPANPKTPLFFSFGAGRCARGCIGDGTWYAVTTTKAHQSACRRGAGDTRFFEHVLNLSRLVLAEGAKSRQTATANLLDRTKDSALCLSIGHDLLNDLAVLECATVTEPHLAMATGV